MQRSLFAFNYKLYNFCENNKKVLTNYCFGAKIGCNLRKWGSYALFMP